MIMMIIMIDLAQNSNPMLAAATIIMLKKNHIWLLGLKPNHFRVELKNHDDLTNKDSKLPFSACFSTMSRDMTCHLPYLSIRIMA